MRYKITNTTVKEPKINPKTGKDIRKAGDRMGHGVTVRTNDGGHHTIQAGRSKIFDQVNEGMLRLRRGKFVSIEEITDVSEVLKNHTLDPRRESAPAEDTSKEVSHVSVENRMAKATEMGKDGYGQQGGQETDEAVNPDGDPNFFVKADKNFKRKLKSEKSLPVEASPVEAEK